MAKKRRVAEEVLRARASLELKPAAVRGQGVRLTDVQLLAVHALLGPEAVPCPAWVFIKNRPLLSRVLLVQLSGLDQQLWVQHKALLPALEQLGPPVPVTALRSNVRPAETSSALLQSSLPAKKGSVQAAKRGAQGGRELHSRPWHSALTPTTSPQAAVR
ncbi:exonuclease domain-containing protein [Haematococcus lacustris]|uniref:Exonuclease domain-containing protein n=1 Tax=Haematococcus lacustris TaxID=44745 RepID=A0A699Z884_HAELA|nr:exonuclease domain-containing protein [Haematococcus lacustris]